MISQRHQQLTKHEVSRLFGKDFAAKLFTLPVSSWQGPITSGYGLHLVRIDNKTVIGQPELERVRKKVSVKWLDQQRRTMNEALYQNMQQRYEIVIEDSIAKETNFEAKK